MSMPFLGREFTFTQPDGSELQVKAWGNPDEAIFETLEGFTVVLDPLTGFYQYARLSDDGSELVPTGFQAQRVKPRALRLKRKLRTRRRSQITLEAARSEQPTSKPRWKTRLEIARMKQRSAVIEPESMMMAAALPQRAKVGAFVGLCLLIDFPDLPGTISRQEVEDYCNKPGYNGFGNNGSVRDYFMANSDDKLCYTNLVAPYYRARNNRSYYTDPTQIWPRRAQELLREALDWLRTQNFDLTSLSVDSEQHVYATNVFYAGGQGNWMSGLWPHFGILTPRYELMPGKIIADYQITNMGHELTLGTFCHESGHMICDFPDLYDRTPDGGRFTHGVGKFCLMGYGGEIDKKNPTQINAYLKHRAGWANSVTDITPGLQASISAGINDFYMLRKNDQEYFIIENRQKTGVDRALPGSGLAIWHVDELGNNDFQQMTPERHYECSLEQADGLFDLERAGDAGQGRDLFHGAGTTSFSDATTPDSRWWDGSASGLNISNISNNGPIMSFTSDD